MKKTEKEMRDIFSQDIQISDVVETRIQETYKQLEKRNVRRRKAGSVRKIAAAIAAVCLFVPGVVYASSKTEFFQAMFGNETRESNGVLEREVDTGKEGKDAKVTVTLPSRAGIRRIRPPSRYRYGSMRRIRSLGAPQGCRRPMRSSMMSS